MESFLASDAATTPPGQPSDDDVDLLVSLGRGVGHPTRSRILLACAAADRPVQRPVDLARALDLPLGVVSYHVRTLAGLGLLVLCATTAVRGAVAHDYALSPGVAAALAALLDASQGSSLTPRRTDRAPG